MKHMNGFELAGQGIKVNYVTERADDMLTLDGEDIDVGIGMSRTSRAALMAKLSEGHKAGLLQHNTFSLSNFTSSQCLLLLSQVCQFLVCLRELDQCLLVWC